MQLISVLTALAAFKATAALPVSDNDHTHIPGMGRVSLGTDENATRELDGAAATDYGVLLCEDINFLGLCAHLYSQEKRCGKLACVQQHSKWSQSELGT